MTGWNRRVLLVSSPLGVPVMVRDVGCDFGAQSSEGPCYDIGVAVGIKVFSEIVHT